MMGNSIDKSSSEHSKVEGVLEDPAFEELNCMFNEHRLFRIKLDINLISSVYCIQDLLNQPKMQFVLSEKVYNP